MTIFAIKIGEKIKLDDSEIWVFELCRLESTEDVFYAVANENGVEIGSTTTQFVMNFDTPFIIDAIMECRKFLIGGVLCPIIDPIK